MENLKKPNVMLDDGEKWYNASYSERLYHAAYLQQQIEMHNAVVEKYIYGKWHELAKGELVCPMDLFRLKS